MQTAAGRVRTPPAVLLRPINRHKLGGLVVPEVRRSPSLPAALRKAFPCDRGTRHLWLIKKHDRSLHRG